LVKRPTPNRFAKHQFSKNGARRGIATGAQTTVFIDFFAADLLRHQQ
jgi:hypothetical protein